MDYKNGKIYCIRNNINDEVYVGSTTQSLSKRMVKHRSDAKCRNKDLTIYKTMNELGIDNFYIELIEEHPCENKEQLGKKESEFIRQKGILNMQIQSRTKKEWHEEHKEHLQKMRKEDTKKPKSLCQSIPNNTESRIKTKLKNETQNIVNKTRINY